MLLGSRVKPMTCVRKAARSRYVQTSAALSGTLPGAWCDRPFEVGSASHSYRAAPRKGIGTVSVQASDTRWYGFEMKCDSGQTVASAMDTQAPP